RPRTSVCKLLSSFSSFSPASVTAVPLRSTPTTGLPGRLSFTTTLPPSFSTAFTASASSARPAATWASSPSTTPALPPHRCSAMTFPPQGSDFTQCCNLQPHSRQATHPGPACPSNSVSTTGLRGEPPAPQPVPGQPAGTG